MRILDQAMARYNYILIGLVLLITFFIVKSFISKLTRKNECPKCQATDAERVPKGFITQMLFSGRDVKKFKCLKCWNMYFVFNSDNNNN
jgi:hypothetical protein